MIYLAEFLGSFFLVATVVGSGIMGERLSPDNTAVALLGNTIPTGAILFVLIKMFGPVSGAHFNPAVTIAFWSMGEFERKDVFPYIFAQILGAVIASSCLYLLLNENFINVSEVSYLGATLPSGSLIQAFGFELIMTFILMIVICSSAVHGKATKDFAGLAIGLTVGLESMFAGPITGASLNPARSIGPAIISGNLENLWIYIIATILGAVFASMVFLRVFKSDT